jgi:hypothetical protein
MELINKYDSKKDIRNYINDTIEELLRSETNLTDKILQYYDYDVFDAPLTVLIDYKNKLHSTIEALEVIKKYEFYD